MSQWLTQRAEFYRVMIEQGITSLQEIEAAFPLGYNVPQAKIEKWFGNLLKVPKDFSGFHRYVNRFKLGADPEFIFQGDISSENEDGEIRNHPLRVDAQAVHLKQGLAFGADNNGRLAELRPYPSRSALGVCASILVTLRWLAVLNPTLLKLQWISGAYLYDDGIGGHVHFGSKRPNRKEEILALDSVEELLVGLNTFPVQEVRARRGGDRHGNAPYGLKGDYRLQTHGYEYRTWPSWLDSPELAFLTITLSKLAVQDPSLLKYRASRTIGRKYQQIRNLLAYYKDTDDDARLALLLVSRRFPRHIGGDFKVRWGLGKVEATRPSEVKIVPPCIKPEAEDIQELFQALFTDTPLSFRMPKLNWSPISAPTGYEMLIDTTNTIHQKGLGEMIWDVCGSKNYLFHIEGAGPGGPGVSIPRALYERLPKTARNNRWVEPYSDGKKSAIYISATLREDPRVASKIRNWLLNGAFPLWRVKDVTADSLAQWKAYVQEPVKKHKFFGTIIYSDQGEK